jgi:hypothetical protein
VTAAGAQFGPPGFEIDLLYLACLAALVLGGSRPLAIDRLLAKRRQVACPSSHAGALQVERDELISEAQGEAAESMPRPRCRHRVRRCIIWISGGAP